MPKFIVKISKEELKALEIDIFEVQDWIQNAISEKARRVMDRIIEQHTNLNYKKVLKSEKEAIIAELILETVKERTERLEEENTQGEDE